MPEAKRFIKEYGGIDCYDPPIAINYISHHTPTFILYGEDGGEMERMTLERLSYEKLHAMVLDYIRLYPV